MFRDLGYDSEATAYSSDGGIDVILRSSDGKTIGVQVKRYKSPIEVEQIRSLAGALVLGGHTRGVLVTTSSFRSGAQAAAHGFSARGLPIELIEASNFLTALGITQSPPYTDYEDWYDRYGDPKLHLIWEEDEVD